MKVGRWPATRIADLCAEVVDCVNKTAPIAESETPFKMIRTTNVRNGWVDLSEVKSVDEPVFEKWTRRGAPIYGDVLLTREAPLGEVGMLRSSDPVFLGQRLVMYRADPDRSDNKFLLYALRSPWVQAEIRSLGSGATVEHMRVPDCENLLVPNPPVDVQRQIGAALGAVDDLIENNRRRIEILEEMARLIYREWFVHFRFPGHEDVKLVDSDLGPIPDGWRVTSIGPHVGLTRTSVTPGKTPEEQFDHYSIPAFDTSQLPSVDRGGDIKSGKYLLTNDCILLSKLNPRLPRAWRVRPRKSNRRSICSTEFLVLEATASWPRSFIFSIVSDAGFGGRLASMAGGTSTSHQRAKPADVMSLPIVEPPGQLVDKFSEQVAPMLDLADNLTLQSDVLAKARDLLLPRLISGELDVSDLDLDLDSVA